MSNFTTNPFGSLKFRDITKQCTFSWSTDPTDITAGTFPDIFLNKDHSTKLEFYSTFSGSGTQAKLQVELPKTCTFVILSDIGVGAQIGADSTATRKVYLDASISSDRLPTAWAEYIRTVATTSMSKRLYQEILTTPSVYGNIARFLFYSNTAGDFAFEIYTINILEIVGV